MPKFELNLSDKQLKKLSKSDSAIRLRKDCRCKLTLNYSDAETPLNSSNFRKHVDKELRKRTLCYNPEMNDIVLRYCNVRVLQPIEANRCRQLHVVCLADIYVFNPLCGSVLTAIVNKKSDNHLGCIMYDVFNVAIIKPTDLPYMRWAGRNIDIGDQITFKVVKVDISQVIPYIIGDLIIESDEIDCNRDSEEKDSVISTNNSLGTSEEIFSDLDDVIESIKDVKSKKRKLSDKIEIDKTPRKKRKLMN